MPAIANKWNASEYAPLRRRDGPDDQVPPGTPTAANMGRADTGRVTTRVVAAGKDRTGTPRYSWRLLSCSIVVFLCRTLPTECR